MKFRRLALLSSVLCFSILATGCGEALYTMTDTEEETIALYAAKIISKYNVNQTTGICNARIRDGELDEAYGITADDSSGDDNTEDFEDFSSGDLNTADGEDGENSENIDVSDGYSFTDAIGIEGCDFTCSSFDVTSEYKASSSFVLTEVKGKKYLVLYINGENISDNDITFDGNMDFTLKVNGSVSSSTQETFLSNDLSTFDGTIKSGEQKEFVLVFQFANSEVGEISSLDLEVTNNGVTRGVTL